MSKFIYLNISLDIHSHANLRFNNNYQLVVSNLRLQPNECFINAQELNSKSVYISFSCYILNGFTYLINIFFN